MSLFSRVAVVGASVTSLDVLVRHSGGWCLGIDVDHTWLPIIARSISHDDDQRTGKLRDVGSVRLLPAVICCAWLRRGESWCDSHPLVAASLRQYAPADIEALREICLRTGAAGRDATELVSNPQLPGDVYAAPYGVLEPTSVLVLENGADHVVGYVLGALDTASFEARCEMEWWPLMRDRYPFGVGARPLDRFFLTQVHEPPSTEPGLLAHYPSHLHINLLPEMQGSGWGRSMIEAMLELLTSRGSIGVHLGVDADNDAAQKFYTRLGFKHLHSDSNELHFGILLNA
jgi:ribosomal protein S18 acetylase RimI-like enzyme